MRSRSVRAALLALIGTRLPVLAVGVLAVGVIGTSPPPTSEALWRVSSSEAGNLLARWDTAWYDSIATEGYHWSPPHLQHENVVFFPLYPLLMRWGGPLLGGHPLLSGLMISLVSFGIALVLLYRLAADELGEAYAGPVILLVSTYPFALFYSAVYTESLFLVLTVGAFYAMRRERLVVAALAGFAAGLTRPNGCWLTLPLLWMAYHSPLHQTWRQRGIALAAALAPMAGTGAYATFLLVRFGDALAFVHGQAAWGLPLALRSASADSISFPPSRLGLFTDVIMGILNIAALVWAAVAIKPIYRRFGPPYALWVGFTVVPPVLAHLFLSAGRFTAVLFPLFFWLATVVPRPRLWHVAGCFAVLQGMLAALFFLWRPVV